MGELLNDAITAAGGLDAWQRIRRISATVSLTGGLYRIKQQPAGMPEVLLTMSSDAPDVRIDPFPDEGQVGYFRPERVWIEENGHVVDELQRPRDSFVGAVLTTPWTPLQLLYFNGYAMWNYLSSPFLFAREGFHVEEIGPHEEAGEIWRRLKVTYPENIPSHCREQVFYFNDKALLQRVDYSTDVAGGVASHYVYDHTDVGGVLIPLLRRVVPRVNGVPKLHGPTAVLLRIWDVNLEKLGE